MSNVALSLTASPRRMGGPEVRASTPYASRVDPLTKNYSRLLPEADAAALGAVTGFAPEQLMVAPIEQLINICSLQLVGAEPGAVETVSQALYRLAYFQGLRGSAGQSLGVGYDNDQDVGEAPIAVEPKSRARLRNLMNNPPGMRMTGQPAIKQEDPALHEDLGLAPPTTLPQPTIPTAPNLVPGRQFDQLVVDGKLVPDKRLEHICRVTGRRPDEIRAASPHKLAEWLGDSAIEDMGMRREIGQELVLLNNARDYQSAQVLLNEAFANQQVLERTVAVSYAGFFGDGCEPAVEANFYGGDGRPHVVQTGFMAQDDRPYEATMDGQSVAALTGGRGMFSQKRTSRHGKRGFSASANVDGGHNLVMNGEQETRIEELARDLNVEVVKQNGRFYLRATGLEAIGQGTQVIGYDRLRSLQQLTATNTGTSLGQGLANRVSLQQAVAEVGRLYRTGQNIGASIKEQVLGIGPVLINARGAVVALKTTLQETRTQMRGADETGGAVSSANREEEVRRAIKVHNEDKTGEVHIGDKDGGVHVESSGDALLIDESKPWVWKRVTYAKVPSDSLGATSVRGVTVKPGQEYGWESGVDNDGTRISRPVGTYYTNVPFWRIGRFEQHTTADGRTVYLPKPDRKRK